MAWSFFFTKRSWLFIWVNCTLMDNSSGEAVDIDPFKNCGVSPASFQRRFLFGFGRVVGSYRHGIGHR